MHREADYLVAVVFRWFPGEQRGCARVGRGHQVAWRAGQPLPHNDGELGSGAGCTQAVGSDTLVVSCIIQPQLVDQQNSRVLSLNSGIRLDPLSILQPSQGGGRITRTVTHKASSISAGQRHCLWRLEDDWRSWWKKWERENIAYTSVNRRANTAILSRTETLKWLWEFWILTNECIKKKNIIL